MGTDCSSRSMSGIYILASSHGTLLHKDRIYYDVNSSHLTYYTASGNSDSLEDFPTVGASMSCICKDRIIA